MAVMEEQLFRPSHTISNRAYIKSLNEYQDIANQAEQTPDKFWSGLADEMIDWFEPYTEVLDNSDYPFCRWFTGGKLNASYLCLDRHLERSGDKPALIWESEQGESRIFSYADMHRHVTKLAYLLKNKFKIKKGDRVALYMPMIPEATFAMLACARLGAIHVVVFGGFSSEVLRDRIIDTDAKLVITADGASRRSKAYVLKDTVDQALDGVENSPKVLVIEHNRQAGEAISWIKNRDYSYNKLIRSIGNVKVEPEVMDSEDPLFVLHTSGSTGKPKGVVHSTAGYMLWAQYTTKNVFDLHPDDIFWCTADIGWITGHTYTVYGPLALGRTTMIYEGVPTFPDAGRWWSMIEKYQVSQFYTAPTAIRMLYRDGKDEPAKYDLSSLRVLGSVGEPINPEAWRWFYEAVGDGKCPIVDTWWQTETGGHMISPLPGATPLSPGSATLPLPGVKAEVLNERGEVTKAGEKGLLCITEPWPAMLRNIWGSPDRLISTYFSTVKKDGRPVYFSGDGAVRDANGYITITGRVDDVINVSGHRVGTAEVESVVANHQNIAEVAIVSRSDEILGEQIVAFVVIKPESVIAKLQIEINLLLAEEIGKVVKVEQLVLVTGLPKTRSGKILRRLLRSVARGEEVAADASTLEDPQIIEDIKRAISEE